MPAIASLNARHQFISYVDLTDTIDDKSVIFCMKG